MGSRGNCVIIEQGQTRIHYGRWVAIAIPSILLGGPEETLDAIRAMERVDELTDTVWAEGGLVVNCDSRSVVYWGGEDYLTPYVRRYADDVWRRLWPGWTITWATFGQPDIARACDVNAASLIATDFDHQAFLFGDAPLLAPEQLVAHTEPHYGRGLLSVRFATGACVDYLPGVTEDVADVHGARPLDLALTLGPALAERLPDIAPAPLLREDAYMQGAAVDFRERQMLVWERWALDERKIAAFQRRWPGWTLHVHADGPAHHMALLGRDTSSFLVPKPECLQKMITALLEMLPTVLRDAARTLLMQVLQLPDV